MRRREFGDRWRGSRVAACGTGAGGGARTQYRAFMAKGDEIAAAIEASKALGAAALNVSGSPLFFTHRQLILDRVAALRLPAIYEWPETAEEGGFAAYGGGLLIDCCYADMA